MLNINNALTHRQSLEVYMASDTQAAAIRLQYIKQASAAIQIAMQQVIANAPWVPNLAAQKFAIGMCADIVEDLFYDVSESDREVVEEAEQEEAKKQREHEAVERAMVRRF